jgi:hypothetical protein
VLGGSSGHTDRSSVGSKGYVDCRPTMTGAGRSLAGLDPIADPLAADAAREAWIGATACSVAVMIEPSRDGDGAAGAQIQ